MMRWTKEKPKEEGYYWCKYLKDAYCERDEDNPVPVEIALEYDDEEPNLLVVYQIGNLFYRELYDPLFDGCLWAGPIPEPEDVK